MALGADRSRIRSLVVWHGMRLAFIGVVIGIGAAFGLTRFIASLLFGVKTGTGCSCNYPGRIKSGGPSRRLDARHARLPPRPPAGPPYRMRAVALYLGVSFSELFVVDLSRYLSQAMTVHG
jgi:hypothetical protein